MIDHKIRHKLVMLLLCVFCAACAGLSAAEEEGNDSKAGRVRFVYDVQDYQTMYDILDGIREDIIHASKIVCEEDLEEIPNTLWLVNSENGECFYVDTAVAFLRVPPAPSVRTRKGIFVFDNAAFYWLEGENNLEILARWPVDATVECIEWKHFDTWMKKNAVRDKSTGIRTSVVVCFAPTFRHKENWGRMRAFFLQFPQREWGMQLCREPFTYEGLLSLVKQTSAATLPHGAADVPRR